MPLLANGKLSLTSFKAYEKYVKPDGTVDWRKTSDLQREEDYRFRFRFFNEWPDEEPASSTSGTYVKLELLLRSWAGTPERDLRYYASSSYSGTPQYERDYTFSVTISPQKSKILYVYFRWVGQGGMLVEKLAPRMKFSGVEQRRQGFFSAVPLVPNVA